MIPISFNKIKDTVINMHAQLRLLKKALVLGTSMFESHIY